MIFVLPFRISTYAIIIVTLILYIYHDSILSEGLENNVGHKICSLLVTIAIPGTCFAQNVIPSHATQDLAMSAWGKFSLADLYPEIAGGENLPLERQFPTNLVPAIRSDSVVDESIKFAYLAASESTSSRPGASKSQETSDDNTITVTGPKLPKPPPELETPENRLRKVRREVARLEVALHVLSAIDGIATISCVSRGRCRELNPLMGSHPSALRVIGIKSIAGLLFHRMLRKQVREDPYKARKVARISVGFQAAITGFSMSASF
jgi:hypothetical protein